MSSGQHGPWEYGASYFVGVLNIIIGAMAWVEGTIIPHFMIWGGAGLLVYNWRLAFKRSNKE